MKVKDCLKYLFYIAVIFFIILLKGYIDNLAKTYFEQTFRANYIYLVISVFIGVCIGVALGLEHIIREKRKEGTWKINLPKLIFAGIPVLYISLTHIWIYSGIQFLQDIIAYLLRYFSRHGLALGFVSLFQLIFGHIVITSFYKCNDEI